MAELRFIVPDDRLYSGELELRFRVLREPLGMRRDQVTGPFERESLHLVAVEGDEVVGCVLFRPEGPDEGRLFQMAVHPSWQGQGLGARLVRHLEQTLRARSFRRVTLHARVEALPFYERLGYAAHGAEFLEVGIPHRTMARIL